MSGSGAASLSRGSLWGTVWAPPAGAPFTLSYGPKGTHTCSLHPLGLCLSHGHRGPQKTRCFPRSPPISAGRPPSPRRSLKTCRAASRRSSKRSQAARSRGKLKAWAGRQREGLAREGQEGWGGSGKVGETQEGPGSPPSLTLVDQQEQRGQEVEAAEGPAQVQQHLQWH